MKWLLIVSGAVVGLLLVLWLGIRAYYAFVVNDQVAQELIENPQGDRARLVMLLTFPDGRELPVNYLREGNQVFVGADGRWWRDFREGTVPVKVFIRGEQYGGRARTIMDDPDYISTPEPPRDFRRLQILRGLERSRPRIRLHC